MAKLTDLQKQTIIETWNATGAIIKPSGVWVATASEFWQFMEAVLADAHAPPTPRDISALLQASVAAFNRLSPTEQNAMLQKQRESWARGEAGMGNDADEAARRQAYRDVQKSEPVITPEQMIAMQDAAYIAHDPKDPRPINCRFRLIDEGKPYPKSACSACGRSIMTGLGKSCHHVAAAKAE